MLENNKNNNNNYNNQNLSQKINILLRLKNYKFFDNSFQIKLEICNNKQLKKFDNLGLTESKMGEEIIFDKYFTIDYLFEKEQLIKITIISEEDNSFNYSFETTVGTIMGTKSLSFKKNIFSEEDDETLFFDIFLDAKNAEISRKIIKFKTEIKLFPNTNKNINNNEIFFVISNKIDGKNFRNTYKSEEIIYKEKEKELTENSSIDKIRTFTDFILYKNFVCENDDDEILINFYDEKFNIFAKIETNLSEIREKDNDNKAFNLNDNISSKKIGSFKVKILEKINKTFVDYLADGMQINLVIGIDFTASNGQASEKNSLHSFNLNEPNFYERAIQSCGQILSYYDYDKIFPVYGFGSCYPGCNTVSHCFNLNLTDDPNIYGLENIIRTYKENVYKLNFSGPTYFSPLINNLINIVEMNKLQSNDEIYYILLILTDGQINDMGKTSDAIIKAAFLPISIIIIGIGNADFSNMNNLGK
jgi:hypothetical protein